MKPFNLKEALAGKPVVTKNGGKVIRLFNFPEAQTDVRLVALVQELNMPYPFYLHLREDGFYEGVPWLFMASTVVTMYGNVYGSGDRRIYLYLSKKDADDGQGVGRVAVATVTWEE